MKLAPVGTNGAWSSQVVVVEQVIIEGADAFLLVYDGPAAAGNLIGSIAGVAGTDAEGNPYVIDIASYLALTGTFAGTHAIELANQSTPFGPTLAGLTISNLDSPPALPAGMAGANSSSGSRYRILSGAGADTDNYFVIDTYSAAANPYSTWFPGALCLMGPATESGTVNQATVFVAPTPSGLQCQIVADIWNYVNSGFVGPIAIAPNFASDWSNFGSGDAPLAYRLTPDNSVEIDGVVTPSAGASSLLFTLPGDYQPRTNQWIFGANVSAGQAGWWVVHNNGQVTTGNSVVAGDAYVINGKYSLNI